MSEIPESKKKVLKEIIGQLHAEASPQEVKERCRGISPSYQFEAAN